MKNLTKNELDKIFDGIKNLTNKPIYIYFYATWWGPCKMFKQVLDEVSNDYNDKIALYKVDVENERDIAMKYGARSMPYMVFISKDGDITTQLGGIDKNTLKYYFDGLLTK